MTAGRGRRRGDGGTVGLARSVGLVVIVLMATTAVAIPAEAQEATSPPSPPSVDLVGIDPWVAVGDPLTIDVIDTDTDTAEAAAVVDVRVNVHAPVTSPEGLATALDADHGPLLFTLTTSVAELAETEAGGWRLTLDVSDTVNEGTTLRMATPGVYPVTLTPIADDGVEGEPIRTVVIRHDSAGDQEAGTEDIPTLGLLIDISTAPTIRSAGRRPFTDAEADRFDRLSGLVSHLVGDQDGSGGIPFTVTTTADTLAGITGSDREGAHRLHEALANAIAANGPAPVDVIAQGVGTFDIPDLLAVGLAEHVAGGAAAGRDRIASEFGSVLDDHWFVTGRFDTSAAELLADIGFRTLVIDADRLIPAGADTETRDPVTAVPADASVGGLSVPLSVTVVDTATSAWLTNPATDRTDGPDRAAIALAELMVRALTPAGDVAVTIDDLPADSPLAAMVGLLTRPDAPVEVRPLGDLGAPVSADIDDADFAVATDASSDDLQSVTDGVRAVSANIATLTGMLTDQTPLGVARELLAASLSTGLSTADRRDLIDEAYQITAQVLGNISFTGSTNLNITSRRATLPIMFDNENTFDVEAVVHASSDRLRFPEGDHITVTLAPGVTRIDLPVEAQTSGSVPLFIQLQNPEGTVVSELRYNIRSTAISGVGLVVSGGALAVLIVWWGQTWRNRRRGTAVS